MSDPETIAWYDGAADAYAKGRPSPPRHLTDFIALLPPKGAVLDLGCGGGTATAALTALGFAVTGLDASAGLLNLARQAAPGARFIEADFSALEELAETEQFDGVWAHFSLLHAPRADMPTHLGRIARLLRPDGLFHLSLMLGEGEARDRLGRFYSYYQADEIGALLDRAGFRLLSRTEGTGASAAGDPVRHIITLSRRG